MSSHSLNEYKNINFHLKSVALDSHRIRRALQCYLVHIFDSLPRNYSLLCCVVPVLPETLCVLVYCFTQTPNSLKISITSCSQTKDQVKLSGLLTEIKRNICITISIRQTFKFNHLLKTCYMLFISTNFILNMVELMHSSSIH